MHPIKPKQTRNEGHVGNVGNKSTEGRARGRDNPLRNRSEREEKKRMAIIHVFLMVRVDGWASVLMHHPGTDSRFYLKKRYSKMSKWNELIK